MATAEKKNDESLQTQQPPGALQVLDYGDDEGSGFEHQTKDDYTIPFIVVLQALSPQVKKREHDLAIPGNLFNTVTKEYYDGTAGILFVPATTRHAYCKWVHRDEGGGFRGQLDPDDPLVLKAMEDSKKFGKYETPDLEDEKGRRMLQLVETFYVYGVLCDGVMPVGSALIAYTSTKISAYKTWMSRMRGQSYRVDGRQHPVKPPMFANLTRVTGEPDSNNKGDFFIFKMSSGDPRGMRQSLLETDDLRFLEAKAVKELVDSGKAKVDYTQQSNDAAEGGTTTAF